MTVCGCDGEHKNFSIIIEGGNDMGNRQDLYEFIRQEDGVGVIEVVLILVGILTLYYGVGIRCIG